MNPGDSVPAVAVCILNWNGRAYLDDCLRALAAQDYPRVSATLVDNGSTDGSAAFVRAHFPAVAVIETGANLGFAAGNNIFLRGATTDIVVLLNPDVILSPDCLSRLVEALAAEPDVGIAGCKLWYPGRELIQHAGGIVRHPQGMPDHYGVGERDAGQHGVPRDVDYIIGAAMAIRREALEQVGLLDEGMFLYFEDTDYCFRARAAGWRVRYVPQATAVHVESATAVKGSAAYLRRFHASRWRFLLKHFDAGELAGATLAAERAWLERVDAEERDAAALAYQATLRALPAAYESRAAQGAGPMPRAQRRAVERGLVDLLLRARAVEPGLSGRLTEHVRVEERPFASRLPLLARFREAWNNVATRWYVRPILQQQNEFNHDAAAYLEGLAASSGRETALLDHQAAFEADLRGRLDETGRAVGGARAVLRRLQANDDSDD